jgi:hypothetical protein
LPESPLPPDPQPEVQIKRRVKSANKQRNHILRLTMDCLLLS